MSRVYSGAALLFAALLFASCNDSTGVHKEEQITIQVISPTEDQLVPDSIVTITGFARIEKGGIIDMVDWSAHVTATPAHGSVWIRGYPNLDVKDSIAFSFSVRMTAGSQFITLRMSYAGPAPDRTNGSREATRLFRVYRKGKPYVIEGMPDSVFQRSLMYTIRDTVGLNDTWRATVVVDPGTAAQKTLQAEAAPYLQKVTADTRRIYYQDTLPTGGHRVVVRITDETGLVDSLVTNAYFGPTTVAYIVTPLPGLGGTDASAVAINSAGDIAGWALDATGRKRATRWHAGAVEALDAAVSQAVAINNPGDVFGTYTETTTCGARWSGGVRTPLTTSSGTCMTSVIDANNAGSTLGLINGAHSILRADGSTTRLTFLNGYSLLAYDFNDQEQVVGQANQPDPHAAAIGFTPIYPPPFNTTGGHWTSVATHINNSGQFLGYVTGYSFFEQIGADPRMLAGAFSVSDPVGPITLTDNGTILAYTAKPEFFLWRNGRTSAAAGSSTPSTT